MTLTVEIGATDADGSDGTPVVIWWVTAGARVLAFAIINAQDLQEVADGDIAGPSPRPPDR